MKNGVKNPSYWRSFLLLDLRGHNLKKLSFRLYRPKKSCHFEPARNPIFLWLSSTNLLPGVSPRAIHIEPFQGLNTKTGFWEKLSFRACEKSCLFVAESHE